MSLPMVKVAVMPPNATAVAPLRLVPVMVTPAPPGDLAGIWADVCHRGRYAGVQPGGMQAAFLRTDGDAVGRIRRTTVRCSVVAGVAGTVVERSAPKNAAVKSGP